MTGLSPVLSSAIALASPHPGWAGAQGGDSLDPPQEQADDPVAFEIVYTADAVANLSGGVERGARYLDNLDLILAADLDALIGWRGADFAFHAIYNNGTSISALAGDAMAVSNIETGTRSFRILEAWIEQPIGADASVKAGLYDLNSEFDVLESANLFVGSAHGIGMDIGQTGENGPSIFPVTSLGVRFAGALARGLQIRVAALDAVPGDPDDPGRTAIRLDSDEGALLIGEAEMSVGGTKVLAGHWRYTASFDDFAGGSGKGNAGYYLRAEAPLVQADNLRLDGFARLGTAAGRFNMFDRFLGTGLVLSGIRDDDAVGLALAAAWTSREYQQVSGADGGEFVVEATYRAPLSDYLTLQPNVQYVIDPSADPTLDNAFIAGLRVELGAAF